jgi:hypothetical protein
LLGIGLSAFALARRRSFSAKGTKEPHFEGAGEVRRAQG